MHFRTWFEKKGGACKQLQFKQYLFDNHQKIHVWWRIQLPDVNSSSFGIGCVGLGDCRLYSILPQHLLIPPQPHALDKHRCCYPCTLIYVCSSVCVFCACWSGLWSCALPPQCWLSYSRTGRQMGPLDWCHSKLTVTTGFGQCSWSTMGSGGAVLGVSNSLC